MVQKSKVKKWCRVVAAMACAAIGTGLGCPASADDLGFSYASNQQNQQISLAPIRDVYDHVADSRDVLLITQALVPNSDMVARLQEAAAAGASVSVGIDAPPAPASGSQGADDYARMQSETNTVAADLALLGIRIRRLAPAHVAVAILDDMLYVSNHEWPVKIPDDQFVICDTAHFDQILVERAFTNDHPIVHTDWLWLRKPDSLKAEAGIIAARTSDEVDVMTSELDASTPVYESLQRRAKDNDHPHLIISATAFRRSSAQRDAIAELQREGVDVRLGEPNEFIAIEGDNVWYGSAPATSTPAIEQPTIAPIEIAFAIHSPDLAARLHTDFINSWNAASPVAPRSRAHGRR